MIRYDIRKLARKIRERREELIAERGYRVVIGDVMSRILEHDPEYEPPRKRKGTRERKAMRDPRVSSLVMIANVLQTTPNDLLGFSGLEVSKLERRRIREFVLYVAKVLKLDDPELDK